MIVSFDDIPVRDDLQTVAFYNVENLFDYVNDKHTNDNDFLPTSVKNWTQERYENKLRKLGFAISNIGRRETGKNPAIVGLAEVENGRVLKDLLATKHLKNYQYKFVHYNSLDERGIDVALIYDSNVFTVLHSEPFSIELTDDDGTPDYTRDILLVRGILDGENTNIIVNHWSSRKEGEKQTEEKRIISSNKVEEIIALLRAEDENAKVVVLGDFNDGPQSKSIKQLVNNCDLYNPMEKLQSFNRGTVKFDRKWYCFDQILISTNYFETSTTSFEFYKANIFDEDFLKLFNGPYKGAPFRTYVGKRYHGGYSDHFPVYAVFKK